MTTDATRDSDPHGALVPQLERELVAAASRAPRLVSLAISQSPVRRRVWQRSPPLAAALVILTFCAAALAGQRLFLSGAPVPLPRGVSLQPRSGLGVPLPGSSPTITLQVSDPAGGPPWGVRFVATTRGYGCLQFGRVLGGALGVIGQDGAFSNDGRFHALPLDYLDGPFPCAPRDARGHAFAGVFIDGAPASAQVAEESCSARGGVTHDQRPVCPAADERLVMAGMAGPLARTVTYAEPGGELRTINAIGPQGAYLIVLRAPAKLGMEGGEYEPGGPGVGTIRQITYTDGQVCNTGQELRRTTRACRSVGEHPAARPGVTQASVASPVSVILRNQAVYLRDKTEVLPMFIISFRARIPVNSGASAYFVSVSCGSWGYSTEGPVLSDVRRGQIVTREVAQNDCRGTARVRVTYQDGGHTDGLPFSPSGTGLTVGTRTIKVP
jgi:hypothetical protein